MFKQKKSPQSINFLESVYAPTDIWSRAYIWLVEVGKYLLIAVELVVLGVFFSRFVIDKKNNDLTEEINDNVAIISNESWRQKNILFENYQNLLSDVGSIRKEQEKNLSSTIISELIGGIPSLLVLDNFAFTDERVSMGFTTTSSKTVSNYESALKNNPEYSDVLFNIVKEKSDISLRVTFNLAKDQK